MNKMKKMLVLLLCAGVLSGCTKSTVTEQIDYSNLPQPDENGIVWEQLWEDWTGMFEDQNTYPFAETVNGGIYPEENAARFFLLLNTEITPKEAQAYAMEVLNGFGYLIAEQNSDYTHPDSTSYGSYLDAYDIYVMVSTDAAKADEGSWILEDTIPAGGYRPVQIPDTGEEETTPGPGPAPAAPDTAE